MKFPKLSETLSGPKAPDRCQSCSAFLWGGDPWRWREHDDDDKPTPVVVVLCKDCSRQLVKPHPRLYAALQEFEHHPGSMELCQLCRNRDGVSCPLSMALGGPGVAIAPAPSKLFIRASKPSLSGLHISWREARECSRREVLAIAGGEG
jgi:hypothetical protein